MSRVVDAYLRLYTPPQLEQALQQALEDYASGKTSTSLTFEGSATSAAIRGNPENIISVLEAALSIIDAGGVGRSQIVAQDFSRRICAS